MLFSSNSRTSFIRPDCSGKRTAIYIRASENNRSYCITGLGPSLARHRRQDDNRARARLIYRAGNYASQWGSSLSLSPNENDPESSPGASSYTLPYNKSGHCGGSSATAGQDYTAPEVRTLGEIAEHASALLYRRRIHSCLPAISCRNNWAAHLAVFVKIKFSVSVSPA